jgi:hypothetical protein
MEYARSTLNTCKGTLSCSWEKFGNFLKISITIPVGMKAETWIPIDDSTIQIRENSKVIWKESKIITEHMNSIMQKENYLVYTLGSGFYNFEIE